MKTLIAIPCMEMIPLRMFTSVLALRREGESEFTITQSSLIYEARDMMAREAEQEGFDRVLWLDSDMAFEPDVMAKLSAWIDNGADFVSGLYFQRKEPHGPVAYKEIRMEEHGPKAIPIDRYKPKEIMMVEGVGMGLCMTTTKLLREVRKNYGLPFFPVAGLGEDLSFCARVRELGYPIWLDPTIRAGHIGTKIYTEEDWIHE